MRNIKWSILLKWWIFFSLVCVGGVIAAVNGVFSSVFAVDFTKLSVVIGIAFILYLIKGGVLVYKMSRAENLTKDLAYDFCADNEDIWFVSDSMLTVGMIGTVLGFIFMLSTTFAGVNTLTISYLQSALIEMSGGAGVALYTTASGLICGMLLRLQAYSISRYLDRQSRKFGFRLEY